MSRGWHAIYLPHAEDHLQSVHGHRRCRGVPEKWSLSYWNDDIANVVMRGMQGADALLLGGVTYEGFAEACGRGRSGCGLHEQRAEVRGVTHLDLG